MWRYQKPGFESLLLAELQRQQQCSQFCDTMLKAGGVSVPAHSCILSAVSPHISLALSSSLTPPSGQSHHLEFQALGACTLLHIVSLLYSGEMAGEGENEKREAIYAAAKLGISDLVEVTRSRGRLAGGMEQVAEVAVQTEEEDEGRRARWRREERDGITYLWKETPSEGGRDMWTQTEEQFVNSSDPLPSVVPYETIDMSLLQSFGLTDSHQYVPVTPVYPREENQALQPSSGQSDCLRGSSAFESTSMAVVAPQYTNAPPTVPHVYDSCLADPHSCWADRNPDPAEWGDENLAQFKGNIAGFINCFLNPEKQEQPPRRRAGRPRGARGEQKRTRRPRQRAGGRGWGGFTQTVDVQEIGLGKLQKLFLRRWGVQTPRTGQGGGAVGRKLYLKTREELESAKKAPRRRGQGKVFEVDHSQDSLQGRGGGEANSQRGRRPKNSPQFSRANPSVGRGQNSMNQPASDYPSGSTKHLRSGQSLSSSSPSLQLMPSSAAVYVSTAASLLHSPQFAPPLQPEHIDRLLEEVIMELDILPNNKAPLSQFPLLTSSHTSGACSNSAIQDKQETQISSSEAPLLKQKCEGKLSGMLDNLLQSFERHVESTNSGKENKERHESYSEACQPEEAPHTHQVNRSQTPGGKSDGTRVAGNRAKSQEASPCWAISSEKSEETVEKSVTQARRQKRRRANTYLFSLEKKKKTKKTAPVCCMQQGENYQRPEETVEKSPSEVNKRPGKYSRNGFLKNNWVTKSYPLRGRCIQPQIQDVVPFLEENLTQKSDQPPQRCCWPKKNRNVVSSSHVESKTNAVQLQASGSCYTNDRTEKNQGGVEEGLMWLSQEETEERGTKRRADYEFILDKRICSDRITTSETLTPSSQSAGLSSAAATLEDLETVDIETVSLSSLTDCLQATKQEDKPIAGAEENLSGGDTESNGEMIDVDGDHGESAQTVWQEMERCSVSPSRPGKNFSPEWTGKCENEDEDIDVTEASAPAPDPVIICWTESSESEEEVDVVGEQMNGASFSFVIHPAWS